MLEKYFYVRTAVNYIGGARLLKIHPQFESSVTSGEALHTDVLRKAIFKEHFLNAYRNFSDGYRRGEEILPCRFSAWTLCFRDGLEQVSQEPPWEKRNGTLLS